MSQSKPSAPKQSNLKGRPPANKARSKSIVNQKQTPWGVIITAIVLVLFAGGIIAFALTRGGSDTNNSKDPYRQPALADAMKISGVTYKVEADHTHKSGVLKYDAAPPIGGNHNGYWADCTGTVYDNAIANENATHMLEHGAVWITYNKDTLPADQLATLKKDVDGVNGLALSPFPDLKSPISLQAWGYQLFIDQPNANDPRIEDFINVLKFNKATTPEYGASCSQPTFKASPSTFGHPIDGPTSGSAATMPAGT